MRWCREPELARRALQRRAARHCATEARRVLRHLRDLVDRSVPVIEGQPRLPREIEADPRCDEIRGRLHARVRPLWLRGSAVVPVVPFSDPLRRALAEARSAGLLVRGLEAAASVLAAERRGLQALPANEAARHGVRVSRLLMATNDGAERFYRQVEPLGSTHAPRVLTIVLDCDGAMLGELAYGAGAAVKLVLTGHKTAVVAILRALAA